MALLLDGDLNTLTDLRTLDSNILDVANVEGIDLTVKLERAQEDLEDEVETWLREDAQVEARTALKQVAATRTLRRYHALRTLEAAYRDAYYAQLNDRYAQRLKEYRTQADEVWKRIGATGLGMVSVPLPRPAGPETTVLPGPLAAADYFAQMTWVNAQGEESAASRETLVKAGAGHSLLAAPPAAPATAAGWHLYLAVSGTAAARQTETALALGQAWTMPGSGLRAGEAPGGGQSADGYLRRTATVRRG